MYQLEKPCEDKQG